MCVFVCVVVVALLAFTTDKPHDERRADSLFVGYPFFTLDSYLEESDLSISTRDENQSQQCMGFLSKLVGGVELDERTQAVSIGIVINGSWD